MEARMRQKKPLRPNVMFIYCQLKTTTRHLQDSLDRKYRLKRKFEQAWKQESKARTRANQTAPSQRKAATQTCSKASQSVEKVALTRQLKEHSISQQRNLPRDAS